MSYGTPPERQKLLSSPHYPAHKPRPEDRHRTAKFVTLALILAGIAYFSCPFPWHGHRTPPQPEYEWTSEGWYPTPRGGTVESWKESYEKAADLVGRMSLLEKVNVTTGVGWQQGLCLGNTAPAVNVGFPSLCLQDGPLGLRHADHATAWPAALTVGATWNKELAFLRGKGHGEEARRKGVNVLLGPSMGPLGKLPAGGRNWEGFGSDPYLQGVQAAQTIKGIQSEGVIATAKHFILNEQEHFRQILEWKESPDNAISSNADDRTLHELYLWPFADSVRAGVASVMCSYNQVNNTYACGNSKILNGILKDELGFQGFVQSDWYAARDGIGSVLGGLDVMMPGNIVVNDGGYTLFGANLTAAVINGTVPIERLDDMAIRVVAAWYQLGQDDKEKFPEDRPNFSSWTDEEEGYLHHGAGEGPREVVNKYVDVQSDHSKIARQIAVEGIVLVQNDGILPLERGAYKDKNIGIYGEDAGDEEQEGYPNFCPDRGCNYGSLASGWGSGAVEYPHFHSPLTELKKAFNTSTDDIPNFTAITNNAHTSSISKSAREQDLCFAFVNADAGEGYIVDPVTGAQGDRVDLYAQNGGDNLVLSVADNCKNTIVIVHTVGPIIMERWISHPSIRAVVIAHLPGQESGNSLASILFGDENPSGKLPYTIAKSLEDYGPGAQLLYHPNAPTPQQTFSEGLNVDYRHFDTYGITPRFEFGFGLSYTSFTFSTPELHQLLPKTPFPPPRPDLLPPPEIAKSPLPNITDLLFPEGFRRLKEYIYPNLPTSSIISPPYPRTPPSDYDTPRPLSPAGGGEGGNPALWDVIATLDVTVRNVGDKDGAEVAQLYISFPEVEGVEFSKKVLRGFEKVFLKAGEEKVVTFEVRRRDVSFWDVEAQNWRMPTGRFGVSVGRSSRDLALEVLL